MAQKASPNLTRFGYNKIWTSEWSGLFNYSSNLMDDLTIRNYFSYVFYCLKCPTNAISLKRSFSSWLYVDLDVYLPEDQRRRFYVLFNKEYYFLKDSTINIIKRRKYFFHSFYSLFYRFNKFTKTAFNFNRELLVGLYTIFHKFFIFVSVYAFPFFTWYYSYFFFFYLNKFNIQSKSLEFIVNQLDFLQSLSSSKYNLNFLNYKLEIGKRYSLSNSYLTKSIIDYVVHKRKSNSFFYLLQRFFLYVLYYKRFFKIINFGNTKFKFFIKKKLFVLSYYLKELFFFLKGRHLDFLFVISRSFILAYFFRFFLFSSIYYKSLPSFRKNIENISVLRFVFLTKFMRKLRQLFSKKCKYEKDKYKYRYKYKYKYKPKKVKFTLYNAFYFFVRSVLKKKRFRHFILKNLSFLISWYFQFRKLKKLRMLRVIAGDMLKDDTLKNNVVFFRSMNVRLLKCLSNPIYLFFINNLRYRFFSFRKKYTKKLYKYKFRGLKGFYLKNYTSFKKSRFLFFYYRFKRNFYKVYRRFFIKRLYRCRFSRFKRFCQPFFLNFFSFRYMKSKKFKQLVRLYRLYLKEKYHYYYLSRYRYKFKTRFKFMRQFKPMIPRYKILCFFLRRFRRAIRSSRWSIHHKFKKLYGKLRFRYVVKSIMPQYRRSLRRLSRSSYRNVIIRFERRQELKRLRQLRRQLRLKKKALKKNNAMVSKEKPRNNNIDLNLRFKIKFKQWLSQILRGRAGKITYKGKRLLLRKFLQMVHDYKINLKVQRLADKKLKHAMLQKRRHFFKQYLGKKMFVPRRFMRFFFKNRMYAHRVLYHYYFKNRFKRSLIIPKKPFVFSFKKKKKKEKKI